MYKWFWINFKNKIMYYKLMLFYLSRSLWKRWKVGYGVQTPYRLLNPPLKCSEKIYQLHCICQICKHLKFWIEGGNMNYLGFFLFLKHGFVPTFLPKLLEWFHSFAVWSPHHLVASCVFFVLRLKEKVKDAHCKNDQVQ